MKKFICVSLIITFVLSLFSFTISAQEVNQQTDPHYDYHLEISSTVDAFREQRNSKIEPHQKEIETFRNASMELYNNFVDSYSNESQVAYNEILNEISALEDKISSIQTEYFRNVYTYLESIGMEIVDDSNIDKSSDDIHLSATDAGYMQTTSSVSYNESTGEFYYFVEYDYNETNALGGYLGLDDYWGDYDLVSMQHKENTDWFWNNIIITANLAYGYYGNSLVGKADKYQILDDGMIGGSFVSNREDFWNGCIFNVKDATFSAPNNFESAVRYITLEGWLEPTGSETSVQVKSEYEHNYKKWVWNSVSVGAAGLNDVEFSLEVSYVKSSGMWRRSAGSRICTIPN